MPRPTELADVRFINAAKRGLAVKDAVMKNPSDPVEHGAALVLLGLGLAELASGLAELSIGLRATYILLEQVQRGPGR